MEIQANSWEPLAQEVNDINVAGKDVLKIQTATARNGMNVKK